MAHNIEFVAEGDLPDGYDWVLVRSGGDYVIFMERARVTPRVLEEAWAAYRLKTIGLPLQRQALLV